MLLFATLNTQTAEPVQIVLRRVPQPKPAVSQSYYTSVIMIFAALWRIIASIRRYNTIRCAVTRFAFLYKKKK